jgi:hypothetical protein
MLGDPELTLFIRHWFNGGSALPVVERLFAGDEPDEAACIARLALRDPECVDRDAIEDIASRCASEPSGWLEALEKFARTTTPDDMDAAIEQWNQLMQFVPEDVFYQRLRRTITLLHRLGCNGDVLFTCSTLTGSTTEVFDLAASGTVAPETIEARGNGSPARAMWLGLAAQAAQARDDRWSVLRYLREACNDPRNAFLAWASISEIREHADAELHEALNDLGVPAL